MSIQNPDVFRCLLDDHDRLKQKLSALLSHDAPVALKRGIFREFLPLFRAHTFAEERTVFSEGLLHEELRAKVLEGLEEHEIGNVEEERMELAVDDAQWEARLKVFCEMLEHHLKEEEEETFPAMKKAFNQELREELGMRYIDTKNKHQMEPILEVPLKPELAFDQTGKIGYVVAWLLGVPFWILLLVFLIRG